MIFFSTIYTIFRKVFFLVRWKWPPPVKNKVNVKADRKLWVGCGGTIRSSASVLLIKSELLKRALCWNNWYSWYCSIIVDTFSWCRYSILSLEPTFTPENSFFLQGWSISIDFLTFIRFCNKNVNISLVTIISSCERAIRRMSYK